MLTLALLVACGSPSPAPGDVAASSTPAEAPAAAHAYDDAALRKMFVPLPKQADSDANPVTPEKVALGKMLFFETRVSKNQDLSCNSCHGLDTYGVDGHPTSTGHKGQHGNRNAPTVYNSALEFAQFWDGRAADVEAQAKGPVLNPVEMAMADDQHVIAVLKSVPGYPEAFAKAFPGDADPMTYDNFGKAIGAYERTLLTPSPFDAYLAGDDAALTKEQRDGLDTFVKTGCNACHTGVDMGGGMYQKLGLVNPYDTQDVGRAAITQNDADKFFFKVPSLRNVEKTGPYFHDGSVATLDDAVRKMAHHQLGKELTDDEVKSIVAFLTSLTGDLPKDAIAKPELPASGPDTPKPDPS